MSDTKVAPITDAELARLDRLHAEARQERHDEEESGEANSTIARCLFHDEAEERYPSLVAAIREARRERDEALSRAAVLCDRLALGRPENRYKDNPRAAYQAGAAKCAWGIRQLARGATNAIHAIADDRNAYAKGRADERADVVRWEEGEDE